MTKLDLPLSRRHLLKGASAVGALGACGSLNSVFAKAPMLGTRPRPSTGFQDRRFREIIATDGGLPLGDPHKNYIGLLSPEETDRQLSENFLRTDNTILEQNVQVVNTGDKLILFDTGLGNLHLFGPTTGRLQVEPEGCGDFDPKDIDAVAYDPCSYRPSRRQQPGRWNEQFLQRAVSTSPRPTSTSGPTKANRRR